MNSQEPLRLALVGNPNCGKTTLFNILCGRNEHVGNYPGVTVEVKVGRAEHDGVDMEVVDLPGAYSLTTYSREEVVTRDYLLDERPGVVINVIDASNVERGLYLTTQLLQMGLPIVLAFNMFDVAESRGFRIHIARLSALLGVPIVPTTAHKAQGTHELLDTALATAQRGPEAVVAQTTVRFGQELEGRIDKLAEDLALCCGHALSGSQCRWMAVKLLENDQGMLRRLEAMATPDALAGVAAKAVAARREIAGLFGDAAEIVLADRRYGFVSGACQESIKHTVESRHNLSDKIDSVVTHPLLGLPIFALMMYLLFQLTFWVGNPLVDWLDLGKEHLAGFVRTLGPEGGIWVSLLADGVVEGVGAVLVFLPLIAMLFFGIAVLESSGYIARAAFVIDNLMHRIGLHGKSFIPMLIGFGCTVPAILATRTLESRRDRLATMMVLPLMSCGARLPVYVLILGAFFPRQVVLRLAGVDLTNQAMILFGIYVLGVVIALLVVRLLRATLFKGDVNSFVMELPPYRLPTWRALALQVWQPTWMYARKAGTIILLAMVVLWALKTWPRLPEAQQQAFTCQRVALATSGLEGPVLGQRQRELNALEHRDQLNYSCIGRIGRGIAPALAPCGFDWKISTGLVGALASKEIFIGQMGVMYAVHEQDAAQTLSLRQHLTAEYTPLQGVCIMLFILIAAPCMATLVAVARESGSWKWVALQWGYLFVLAWLLTTAVYQIGHHVLHL